MGISQLRHLAAAGRTFDKAFFDKERLVNLFQRSGIFSQGSRDSRQTYRSAVKLVDDSRQQLIVDLIQAVTVDVQCLQGIAGNRLIDLSGSFHLCKITHTTQQRVRYTGCTTTTGSNLACSTQLAFHIQDIGTAQHDLRQRLHLIIFEVHIDPETRPERTCQQTAASRRPHQRKRSQVDLDGTGARPFIDHDIDPVIFHRRIQIFLHNRTQPVDLVDKKDIVLLQRSQHSRQIARFIQHRPGSHLEADSQFIRYNVG